jgi:hypothetical protein
MHNGSVGRPHWVPTGIALFVFACGNPDGPSWPPPSDPVIASLALEPSEIHLLSGAAGSIIALARDSLGEVLYGTRITWTSGDTSTVQIADSYPESVRARRVGSTTITATAATMRATATVTVLPAVDFVDVASGFDHECALTVEGAAYCWGDNFHGQLGHTFVTCPGGGGHPCVSSPLPVDGGLRFAVLDVGGGYGGYGRGSYSCGLTPDGSGYCWGSDRNGQLGDGSAGDDMQSRASRVVGSLAFMAIRVGKGHTCGLTTTGEAYCWGANDHGQLGDSIRDTCSPYPIPCSAAPFPVIGELRFASVELGDNHTCGLTTDGDAYCWGDNSHGELGNATADTVIHEAPTLVAGGLRFVTLSLSGSRSCGLTGARQVYCWGLNLFGEVTTVGTDEPCAKPVFSDELTHCRLSPTPVAGAPLLTAIIGTCGISLDGVVYCWGGFFNDAICNWCASFPSPMKPFPVSGSLRFITLSSDGLLCGMATDGLAYCVNKLLRQQSHFTDFGPWVPVPGQR